MNVLLVEDDLHLRALMDLLIASRGHHVIACADAETAITLAGQIDCPLMILDRRLPGMDGLTLCRHLRALPGGDRAVIIVMTGDTGGTALDDILDAGASDYVAKPFDNRTLAVRLAIAERRVQEIAARKALETELYRLALYDALTGIPNRTLFRERLEHALGQSARSGRQVAVLYLDLDDFKAVNDRYGHAGGDRLLVALGQRLTGCVRAQDTLARLGGDEFAAVLDSITRNSEAVVVVERILAAMAAPLVLGEEYPNLVVTLSIGLALNRSRPVITEAVHDIAETVIRRADVALYQAKSAGRGQYAVAKRLSVRVPVTVTADRAAAS